MAGSPGSSSRPPVGNWEERECAVLVSREAAERGFSFASSLRRAGDFSLKKDDPAARRALLDSLHAGNLPLVLGRQVHGARVESVADPAPGETLVPECDGFFGAGRSAFGIFTADCLAVALLDPRSGMRALVHSGWRGTRAGITEHALALLLQHGASLADLLVVCGPSIQSCCYRVGEEFLGYFGENHLVKRADGWYFDNQGCMAKRLIQQGFAPGRIFLHPECSHCRPQRWFSYRREGDSAGRTLNLLAPLLEGLA